jgi:hypothetical protein
MTPCRLSEFSGFGRLVFKSLKEKALPKYCNIFPPTLSYILKELNINNIPPNNFDIHRNLLLVIME